MGRTWDVNDTTGLLKNEATLGGGEQICGAALGHSACAVRETVHVVMSPSSVWWVQSSGVTCDFWGESVRTSVLLPSGKTVSINVLATPHHRVSCDGLTQISNPH
jgi:hypothetical protein